jgi:hypothetical protein
VNVQTAARVLISFAVGILLQGVVDPEAADWQAVTTNGVQTFLKSIRQEQ